MAFADDESIKIFVGSEGPTMGVNRDWETTGEATFVVGIEAPDCPGLTVGCCINDVRVPLVVTLIKPAGSWTH